MTERRIKEDFATFEPLLWRTLGALARHGFAAGPGDARDIIHDFYLEAWQGVKSRFDEDLGTFATYLASAFYRFARRRISGLNSWRQSLVDVDDLARIASDAPTPADLLQGKEQLALIAEAMRQLPIAEREVLNAYLSEADASERSIAARHSMSRYQMRELLLSAIGRLCVMLGTVDAKREDSLVAYYLWHEGRSAKNVSNLVGLPVAEVHRLKTKFASDLLVSVRSASVRPQEGPLMPTPSMAPLELLKRALLAIDDGDRLESVRGHATAIREALDGDSDMEFSRKEAHLLETNPEWLAKVYDAVGAVDRPSDADRAIELALYEVRSNEAREIGEAFHGLLRQLPGEFALWDQRFSIGNVEAEMSKYLRDDPSFQSSSREYAQMTSLGLTPVMFQAAVFALEALFDRLLRQPSEPTTLQEPDSDLPPLLLDSGERRLKVGAALVVAQVRATPGLRPDAAASLTRWLLSATEYRPYLVRGYFLTPRDELVICERTSLAHARGIDKVDLALRWSSKQGARASTIESPRWSITRQAGQSADARAT
jgi:RNA polymerase sigma factor (sigma-70 family)